MCTLNEPIYISNINWDTKCNPNIDCRRSRDKEGQAATTAAAANSTAAASTTPAMDSSTILQSIVTGNIRGLNPGAKYSKIEYLSDLATENNSYIITMTESHLSDCVSDHEIAIEGWSSHRSDRVIRSGGGVITYCRDNLIVSDEHNYSDSISESICLYISNLNMIIVTVYRPPNCDQHSFKKNLLSIDKWLEKMIKIS